MFRWFRKLYATWTMPLFPHVWLGALTSKGAARHCKLCKTTENLTDEMFYAYFGRIPKV
jgi:hypothetical protein